MGKKSTRIVSLGLVAVMIMAAVLSLAMVMIEEEEPKELILATTTSTYDSGLLDAIIFDFEEKNNVVVKIVAVGTGQALALGKSGDADVLLVHAPSKEEEFVTQGHGVYRKDVMFNQFVIVGPSSDPAGVSGMNDTALALQSIVDNSSDITFCSRGDDSGTHTKEKALWEDAGYGYENISLQANASWYMSMGAGMGDTLRSAHELPMAYTLTDEGTFFSMAGELDLEVHVSGDPLLFNQYGVVPVSATTHPGVEQELGEAFADWMISSEVQDMIDAYTKDGNVLFTSNAA